MALQLRSKPTRKQFPRRGKRNGKRNGGSILADRSDRHSLNDFRLFSTAATGLPPTKMVKMRYTEIFRVTSTAGAIGKFLLSANNLYDPNITGAGHQPYGWDQWMALYKTATVVRSRVDVQVATVGSAGVGAIVAGVTFAESDPTVVTGTATPVALIEGNRGTTQLCVAYEPSRHVQSNFDLMAFFPDHDPTDVQSTASGGPNRTFVYCVFQVPTDFASTIIGEYAATVEYEVLLQQPLTIAAS